MGGNVLDDLKHAAKHAGDAIKHGAEDAGKTVKDTADDVGSGDFDKAGADIKHDSEAGASHAAASAQLIGEDLEHALMTSLNDITKIGDKIKGEFTSIENEIKKGITDTEAIAKKGVHDTEALAKTAVRTEAVRARDALEGVGSDIKKGLNEAGDEIKEDLKDFGAALEEVLSSEILKEGLQKAYKLIKELVNLTEEVRANAPEIVDDLNSIEGTIEIGPILCNYSGIVDRLEELAATLDSYLNGRPLELSRALIKTLITDLGPNSVRLDLDEEVISRFGFLAKEVPLSIFTWGIDEILEHLGVPE